MAAKDTEHCAALKELKDMHCVIVQEKEENLRFIAERSQTDRKAVNDVSKIFPFCFLPTTCKPNT